MSFFGFFNLNKVVILAFVEIIWLKPCDEIEKSAVLVFSH